MALQSTVPISLQDIINEHDEGSQVVPDNLLAFQSMFSGGLPIDLQDFLSADQPTGISTGFATNIDAANNQADFSASVTSPGGGAARTDTQCQVAIQYDSASNFPSPSLTSWKTFTNGGADVTWTNIDVSGQSTTTVYYRAVAYNALNTDTSFSVGNTRSFTFCAAPTGVSAVADGFGSITVSWNYGTDPNSFDLEYRADSGNWNVEATGISGNQRSYQHNACSEGDIDNGTLTVAYRIRANCSGGSSDYAFSNNEDPQCK